MSTFVLSRQQLKELADAIDAWLDADKGSKFTLTVNMLGTVSIDGEKIFGGSFS